MNPNGFHITSPNHENKDEAKIKNQNTGYAKKTKMKQVNTVLTKSELQCYLSTQLSKQFDAALTLQILPMHLVQTMSFVIKHSPNNISE